MKQGRNKGNRAIDPITETTVASAIRTKASKAVRFRDETTTTTTTTTTSTIRTTRGRETSLHPGTTSSSSLRGSINLFRPARNVARIMPGSVGRERWLVMPVVKRVTMLVNAQLEILLMKEGMEITNMGHSCE